MFDNALVLTCGYIFPYPPYRDRCAFYAISIRIPNDSLDSSVDLSTEGRRSGNHYTHYQVALAGTE